MNSKIKDAIFKQVAREPFAEKFNLKLIDLDEGYSKVEMVFTQDMENMFGKAHGGALFALIDEAFETASNSHGTIAVALNMNISYLASPSTGSTLRAEAKEIIPTNKDRLCERSEPRSYPVVGRARHEEGGLNISKYLFLNVKR